MVCNPRYRWCYAKFYPSEAYVTMIFGSIKTEGDISLISRNETLYINTFWINDTATNSGTGTATDTGTSDDGNINDVYLELDFTNIGHDYRHDISVNFGVSFDDEAFIMFCQQHSTDTNEAVYLFAMNYVSKIDLDIESNILTKFVSVFL